MKETLIIIDMQNDFVTGPLGTPEAKAIVPAVQNRIKAFSDQGGNRYSLIFTRDTHQTNYMDTFEGKNLPVPHCIEGSTGWEIIPELADYVEEGIVVNKTTFGCMALPQYIAPDTEKIILAGLCTDICVISNALLLRAAFPNMPVSVCADACAGVTPEKHQAALNILESCQIGIE